MKKSLFLSVLCLSMFFSIAQVKIGVEAGGVLSGMLWADEYEYSMNVYNTSPKFGFLAGITADFPVNEMFFVNTGLGFRTSGATINNLSLETTDPDSVNAGVVAINNIYLNATFNWTFALGDMDVFVGAGAYSSYAISGTKEVTVNNQSASTDLKIGTDGTVSPEGTLAGDDIVPIDFGLSFVGGIYVSPKVKLSFGYQHGVLNLSPYEIEPKGLTSDPVYKNRMGFVSVAYMFNGKKD